MKFTIEEIAKRLDGEIVGDGTQEISGVAKIEDAKKSEISFLANLKYEKFLSSTNATAIIVTKGFSQENSKCTLIKVEDPYQAFLYVLQLFNPSITNVKKEIHPTAIISTTAKVGNNCTFGSHVFIGERVTIGDNVTILSNSVILEDTVINNDCFIHPNVTIREQTEIGARVIIHSGTVIGSDGFGFSPNANGKYDKIPQVGKVVLEDDIEIGANCCIDRATMGETRIKRGTKLDNLIQIAHNVIIGEDTVIAAQTGISGSTKIGNHCVIAGQVGTAGHITIADNTTIGAQTGITKSITTQGKTYSGYPAKEHNSAKKIEASIRQLPELIREVRDLKNKIIELESNTHNIGNHN